MIVKTYGWFAALVPSSRPGTRQGDHTPMVSWGWGREMTSALSDIIVPGLNIELNLPRLPKHHDVASTKTF